MTEIVTSIKKLMCFNCVKNYDYISFILKIKAEVLLVLKLNFSYFIVNLKLKFEAFFIKIRFLKRS